MSQFVRLQSPPRFSVCEKYRPFLRIDFRQLCAYCERSEAGLGGTEFFEIDHFKPKLKFPELETHYPNLYYACGKCNRYKSDTWPTSSQFVNGFRFADPCEEDMYVDHLRESEDGRVEPLTNCGDYTSSHIRLNRSVLLNWRLTRRRVVEEIRTFESIAQVLAARLTSTTDPAVKGDIQKKLGTIDSTMARLRDQFSL